MTGKGLLVVAVRIDNPPDDVRRRVHTILAAMNTYDKPPGTVPCMFAKSVEDLSRDDLQCLEGLVGGACVEALNLGITA